MRRLLLLLRLRVWDVILSKRIIGPQLRMVNWWRSGFRIIATGGQARWRRFKSYLKTKVNRNQWNVFHLRECAQFSMEKSSLFLFRNLALQEIPRNPFSFVPTYLRTRTCLCSCSWLRFSMVCNATFCLEDFFTSLLKLFSFLSRKLWVFNIPVLLVSADQQFISNDGNINCAFF